MSKEPYVGPNGESTATPDGAPEWTPADMVKAEQEVRDMLERQLRLAQEFAAVAHHGLPERWRGKYAARAVLLQGLLDALPFMLHPVRYVLPVDSDPSVVDWSRTGRLQVVPDQEFTVVKYTCRRCALLVDSATHDLDECADMQYERHAKNRDD